MEKKKVTQNLIEMKNGICCGSVQANKIWNHESDLIVKGKLYKKEINKLLYLLDNENCYGIIKLKYPQKLSIEDFDNLLDRHKLSSTDRKRWWPNKQVLFGYSFDVVCLYDKPKKIQLFNPFQVFVDSFEFIDTEEQLIDDILNYNPTKENNEQLINNWKVACALYSTKKSGGVVRHSLEDITNLAKKIYTEIKKRVENKELKYDFNDEAKSQVTFELINAISKCKNPKKSKKLSENDDSDKNSGLEQQFLLMEPSQYYSNIQELLDSLYENNQKYAIESDIDGFRCVLIKNNGNISLYSENNEGLNEYFKTILAEATQLSSRNYIIEGKITDSNIENYDFEELMLQKEEFNDSSSVFWVSDIIKLENNLLDKSCYERKQALHSLNFTNHIREQGYIIVESRENAEKAIKLLRNLKNSKGALIKQYDSKYFENQESDSWIKLINNSDNTSGMVDTNPSDVIDKSVTNIRDLANYRKIESIDRGEQGGYWVSFAGDEYFIVDEGVVVWRSSDTYPNLAKKEWEKRTKNMNGKRTKYSDFKLESTTTDTSGISSVQGKEWSKKTPKQKERDEWYKKKVKGLNKETEE